MKKQRSSLKEQRSSLKKHKTKCPKCGKEVPAGMVVCTDCYVKENGK